MSPPVVGRKSRERDLRAIGAMEFAVTLDVDRGVDLLSLQVTPAFSSKHCLSLDLVLLGSAWIWINVQRFASPCVTPSRPHRRAYACRTEPILLLLSPQDRPFEHSAHYVLGAPLVSFQIRRGFPARITWRNRFRPGELRSPG
jgi:hypothetical protein